MLEKINLCNFQGKDNYIGQSNAEICTNFLNSITTKNDNDINSVINELERIKRDSYDQEILFLKEYLKDNQNETLNKLKEINNIDEYINFFKDNKNKNIFKLLLLRREFQTGEEQFIKFLYSSDIIDGLPSSKMESFYMNDERIGSRKPISIYDFVSVFIDTFKKQLNSITSELNDEYAEEIKKEYSDKIVNTVVNDLSKIKMTSMRLAVRGGQKIATDFMKAGDKISDSQYHEIYNNEFLYYFQEDKEGNLYLETEFLQDENFKRDMQKLATAYSKDFINIDTYKNRIDLLISKFIRENNLSNGDANSSLYTAIFFDKKEFKKIEKKLDNTRKLMNEIKSKASKMSQEESKNIDNSNSNNKLNFDNFSDFITFQLNKCYNDYPDALKYWNQLRENPSLLNIINTWYNYNSASLVMGHIGESFAKYFIENIGENSFIKTLGQSKNKLGQQAHIDLQAYDNIGLQVKNFSSVVNSFTLYQTNISVFGSSISRYVPPDNQLYIKIRFLSLYANESNLITDIKQKISLVLYDNVGNFMRYDDLQSKIEGIKNNFYILNFNMIPASVVINSVIEQINSKTNQNNNNISDSLIFDLDEFPSEYNKSDKINYDLSKINQNLVQADGGRIIYNGFKFNLKDF